MFTKCRTGDCELLSGRTEQILPLTLRSLFAIVPSEFIRLTALDGTVGQFSNQRGNWPDVKIHKK
jgi:hypothetical protein